MIVNQVKKRFYFFKPQQKAPEVPFCQEVRDFIEDSHKCQTLYANCEGFYPRRVLNCKQKKLLEEFIFNSLYHSEHQEEESDLDKRNHVKNICDKMTALSKIYHTDDEIHFSVVWVYSFNYELKKKKGIPVFKIFKKKSGREAMFFDVCLTSFESWDCYIENAEFGESFLCIPRHGEYHFDDETQKIDLEYICSVNLKADNNKCLFSAFTEMPFSQTAVRPMFSLIMGKMKKSILRLLHMLNTYWDERKGLNTVIFIIFVWKKFRELQFTQIISNAAFLLLNLVTETSDCNNLLKHDYWMKLTETSFPEFLTIRNSISEISSEGAQLIALVSSYNKDWLEILKLFCSLFRNSRVILNMVSFLAPNCLVIKCLYWILSILEKISETTVSASVTREASEIKNYFPKINADYENRNHEISSTEVPALQSGTLSSSALVSHNKLTSTAHFETQNAVNKFRCVSYDKVLSNLFSLETVSANAVHNLVFEKVQPHTKGVTFSELGILVGEKDGYGIYVFPQASVSRLTLCINQLLKTDFSFKPQGIYSTEIIGSSGETLGFIFYPLEFSALGLFPLNVIKGQEENPLEWDLEF